MKKNINTIIFDLGGVLIDWNPRYLYSSRFHKPEEMEYFLSEVCNHVWNTQQDGGRAFQEATEALVCQFPAYEKEIMAYDQEWEKMLKGSIQESVRLLEELHASRQYKLYALTNWSKEKFPVAQQQFDFLRLFDGWVVSGEVRMVKPQAEIYHHLLEKFSIEPGRAVFIDDVWQNVEAAQALGLWGIHFTTPQACRKALEDLLDS